MVSGEVQILDYTNSQFITLNTGQTKIQTGHFKLIHDIGIEQYQNAASEVESVIIQNVPGDHPLHPYLIHELAQIKDLLHNLTPKVKRSVDAIGTVWKWIAGNPDHEDFITIKQKINNVLENNNKQVILNNIFNNRLNNITNVVNQLSNFIQNDKNYENELISSLQYKIKLIKEDLTNIKYAIHWAKNGVINTMMLTTDEINLATKTLDLEDLPYSTPEEALDFAKVKIITNRISLLYIINIPITKRQTYSKFLIKPVKKHNTIIETPKSIISDRNFNEIYTIVEECNSYNNMTICTQTNLIDIRNNSCIVNILKSRNSKCNRLAGQQIPTIEELSTGLLLVNDFNGTIIANEMPHLINGTYLIRFDNATIKINDLSFTSSTVSSIYALPAVLHPTPREGQYREILSLEIMKELQINNTNQIQLLSDEGIIQNWTYFSLASITPTILIAIVLLKCYNQRKAKIVINSGAVEAQETVKDTTQPSVDHEDSYKASFF